ncbi:MAG: hypothetical protein KKE11_04885 [Gammaproteobacteria bacterium]|nr:hypothetical protein [Gammaproteobacteria bacterium]
MRLQVNIQEISGLESKNVTGWLPEDGCKCWCSGAGSWFEAANTDTCRAACKAFDSSFRSCICDDDMREIFLFMAEHNLRKR